MKILEVTALHLGPSAPSPTARSRRRLSSTFGPGLEGRLGDKEVTARRGDPHVSQPTVSNLEKLQNRFAQTEKLPHEQLHIKTLVCKLQNKFLTVSFSRLHYGVPVNTGMFKGGGRNANRNVM